MRDASTLRELPLGNADVSKGLNLFEEMFVLRHVEDDRSTVTSLGEDERPLRLPDLPYERGHVRAKLGKGFDVLVQADSRRHTYNIAYKRRYVERHSPA